MGEGKGEGAAFTLAEVLITLAIIGVVAAMTIPTLVANYQTRTWNTSATVFERKLEEALKVMNTQSTLAGLKTTENFVEELSKHLKITKTCTNEKLMNCFSSEVNGIAQVVDLANETSSSEVNMLRVANLKTAKDLGQKDWNTTTVGVQFANGTTAVLAYNDKTCVQDPYSNQINGLDCLAIMYDTSGYKTPNEQSKDVRTLNVDIQGTCAFKINGQCYGLAKSISGRSLSYEACQEIVESGDYSPAICSTNATYNSGILAAQQCGGMSKMLQEEELSYLMKWLYSGRDSFNYENASYSNIQLKDEARLALLGLSLDDTVVAPDYGSNGSVYANIKTFKADRINSASGYEGYFSKANVYFFCKQN